MQHEKELAEAKRRAEQEAQDRAHKAHLADLKRQMEEQERLREQQEKEKQAAIAQARLEVRAILPGIDLTEEWKLQQNNKNKYLFLWKPITE